MGWIEFNLCVGLRIDLSETSLKSINELCSVLTEIRSDSSSIRSVTIQNLNVSSLKTRLKYTESRGELYDEDAEEAFGNRRAKDNCFILYLDSISLDSSNGSTLNTNMVYSGGHVEFYHGRVRGKLDPTPEEVDLFEEICRRINMGYSLNWSLRSRGSWANTIVWPPEKVSTDGNDQKEDGEEEEGRTQG
jgi:hypothetical protein